MTYHEKGESSKTPVKTVELIISSESEPPEGKLSGSIGHEIQSLL